MDAIDIDKLSEIVEQYRDIYERKSKELYFLSKHMVTKEEIQKINVKYIVRLLLVLALLMLGYLLFPNGPAGVSQPWNGLSVYVTLIALALLVVILLHILYSRTSLKICTAKEKYEISKKRLDLMSPDELLLCLYMVEITNVTIEEVENAIARNMALYKDIVVVLKAREELNRRIREKPQTYSIIYECGLHERQLKNDVYCKVDACE